MIQPLPPGAPLTAGRILSDAFAVYRGNFVSFTIIIAATMLPGVLWEQLFGVSEASSWVMTLVNFALMFFAQAVLVYGAVEYMAGRRPGVGAAIGRGLGVALPVVGVSILMLIALFGAGFVIGFLAMFLPALLAFPLVVVLLLRVASTVWVVVPAAVIERGGAFGSLRRSADLTHGSRLGISGAIFALMAFMVLSIWGVGFSLRFFVDDGLESLQTTIVVMTVLTYVIMVVFMAIVGTTTAVAYSHLREAREGVGVDELAEIFS